MLKRSNYGVLYGRLLEACAKLEGSKAGMVGMHFERKMQETYERFLDRTENSYADDNGRTEQCNAAGV